MFGFLSGFSFDQVIQQSLDEAKCVVVIWSERSVNSRWVKDEAHVGAEKEKLIPVRIDDSILPLGFKRFQTCDLTNWQGTDSESNFLSLIRDIGQLIGFSAAWHQKKSLENTPQETQNNKREAVQSEDVSEEKPDDLIPEGTKVEHLLDSSELIEDHINETKSINQEEYETFTPQLTNYKRKNERIQFIPINKLPLKTSFFVVVLVAFSAIAVDQFTSRTPPDVPGFDKDSLNLEVDPSGIPMKSCVYPFSANKPIEKSFDGWTIIIASSTSLNQAKKIESQYSPKLDSLGFPTLIIKNNKNKNQYYQVLAGQFESPIHADSTRKYCVKAEILPEGSWKKTYCRSLFRL